MNGSLLLVFILQSKHTLCHFISKSTSQCKLPNSPWQRENPEVQLYAVEWMTRQGSVCEGHRCYAVYDV